jgi:hypothetical protein
MPYDEQPEELDTPAMRAELLNRYGPTERPEVYDDGESLLGQNPDMLPIGFKVPKLFDVPHNPSRRTMGLDLPTAPMTPMPQQTPNPLEAIKNLPMTRRQVLQTPINAAVSHIGKGLIGEAVAPAVESALTQVAPEVAQSTFVRNPLFDEYFEEYAVAAFNNAAENMPNEAGVAGYQKLREYLEDKIPEKTLKKYDKLSDEADYENDDGYLDSAIEAQNKLEDFIYDNLKYLKPDELQDFSNHMIQYDTTPEEFADDVIRNVSNSGNEDAQINLDELVEYLERARSQK